MKLFDTPFFEFPKKLTKQEAIDSFEERWKPIFAAMAELGWPRSGQIRPESFSDEERCALFCEIDIPKDCWEQHGLYYCPISPWYQELDKELRKNNV